MDEESPSSSTTAGRWTTSAAWAGCSRQVRVRLADPIAAQYPELMSRSVARANPEIPRRLGASWGHARSVLGHTRFHRHAGTVDGAVWRQQVLCGVPIGRGTLVVFDCGTGARVLGRGLAAETRPGGDPVSGSILLGHTHWDHIQGLPFFEPLFGDGRWDVYGPRGLGGSLDQILAGQMNYQYFPVALHELGPGVAYHELVEGTFEIGDLLVRTQYLNHPALTLGYRVEGDGAVVCYVADHEPFDSALGFGGDVSASRGDARHVEFLAGADILIHDAQYDASEYAAHVGWGTAPRSTSSMWPARPVSTARCCSTMTLATTTTGSMRWSRWPTPERPAGRRSSPPPRVTWWRRPPRRRGERRT